MRLSQKPVLTLFLYRMLNHIGSITRQSNRKNTTTFSPFRYMPSWYQKVVCLSFIFYLRGNNTIFSAHRGCINRLASHSRTLSSQPAEATQPPAPNRHQSTPVTNSVCLFMTPICAPGRAVGTGPCGWLEASFHNRTVMS